MNSKSDLITNIGIGFAIGAFLALLAGGPEMWGAVSPEVFLAFIG